MNMDKDKPLMVKVEVWDCPEGLPRKLLTYTMNHDDAQQRRVLGIQCRNAFEAGQSIRTDPITR
jgi:hypothetical protein